MSRGPQKIVAVLVLVAALVVSAAAPTQAKEPAGAGAHAAIIGGRPADSVVWGSTVAILFRGRLFCSGSVISPTRVLTAAHCASGFDLSQMTVLANRPRIGDNGVGEAIGVTAASIPPDFGVPPLHDLAVLTLSGPTSAPPIALADATEDAATTGTGALLGAAGFGQRNPLIFGHPRVGILAEITQRVKGDCRRGFGASFLPESMICAIGSRIKRLPVNRGVCFGDSGGPLVAGAAAGPRLVGVASEVSGLPIGCGLFGAPNLYSRVSADLAFVRGAAQLAPPPPPPLASFAGPGTARAQRQVAVRVACSASCTVNLTMTLVAGARARRPTLASLQLGAGQSGGASFPLGRRGVKVLHLIPEIAQVIVRIDATGPNTTGVESHTRLLGFRR